jgi:molybdate-binding protein
MAFRRFRAWRERGQEKRKQIRGSKGYIVEERGKVLDIKGYIWALGLELEEVNLKLIKSWDDVKSQKLINRKKEIEKAISTARILIADKEKKIEGLREKIRKIKKP